MSGRLPVGILISGRGSNMEALIRATKAPDYPARVCVVIANNPDAAGLEIARQAAIPALAIDHRLHGRDRAAHERALDSALRDHGAQAVCLAGYMRLLSPWLVEQWAGRMLNIHPSLLPDLPGLDTHARALALGRTRHGCTVHLVTDEMDAGPVIAQASVPVRKGDTEPALANRVLRVEHLLYSFALRLFAEHYVA